jgi:hypothetical protein
MSELAEPDLVMRTPMNANNKQQTEQNIKNIAPVTELQTKIISIKKEFYLKKLF